MAEFKVSCVKGKEPIIIDYNCYKITIFMQDGVAVKFFKEHNDRWYKIKETNWDYFQLDECIAWAKGQIDNDETGYFHSLLQKQIDLKNK